MSRPSVRKDTTKRNLFCRKLANLFPSLCSSKTQPAAELAIVSNAQARDNHPCSQNPYENYLQLKLNSAKKSIAESRCDSGTMIKEYEVVSDERQSLIVPSPSDPESKIQQHTTSLHQHTKCLTPNHALVITMKKELRKLWLLMKIYSSKVKGRPRVSLLLTSTSITRIRLINP